eukprot:TRINITY_DN1098_c0_g1_i1.p1 TRINITY_DN1098_c0_g1~~TRINITY_DN1098_c0_g1_i1.p1  ORF type:complete len:118 (-),score=5.24 TRINITY_DN1098_c0_g1_i1:106-459(-)
MVLMAAALSAVTLHALCDVLWAQFLLMVVEGVGIALVSGCPFPRFVEALRRKGSDAEGAAVFFHDATYALGLAVGPLIGSVIPESVLTTIYPLVLSGLLAVAVVFLYCLEPPWKRKG